MPEVQGQQFALAIPIAAYFGAQGCPPSCTLQLNFCPFPYGARDWIVNERQPRSQPQLMLRRLGDGTGQRFRRMLRATRRRLRAHIWFPQVPLFILIGLLGWFQLRHAMQLGFIAHVAGQNILDISKAALQAVVNGAPSATAGVFLVVMAFGLLTRSRLAWVIALIAAAVSATLIWLVWPGPQSGKAGLLFFNLAALILLLVSGRAFSRSSVASASLFAIASVVLLITYAVLGTYLLGPGFNPPITDLVTALYFAVVTMSTVGYGDIAPRSSEARLFAISVIILGITVFATSVSALLVPLINRRMEHLLGQGGKKVSRSNHYVIAGGSALARNTQKELVARDQRVTFILSRQPESGWEEQDVVVGDASDLDVLGKADARDAKAVLALGDDDSENAFVVMAAKEVSEKLKTVAVVNDSRNMDRVKRVRPDVIIAPQVLGGELLAMALSGEKVNSDQLVQQLLHVAN